MSKTDRGPATEIPDRAGRSVGTQAAPAASSTLFAAPQAPILVEIGVRKVKILEKIACGAIQCAEDRTDRRTGACQLRANNLSQADPTPRHRDTDRYRISPTVSTVT